MELTKGQKTVLNLLAKSSLKDKFYWTGGTLLSYHYFKHRKSEDLDFFSAQEFFFEEVNQFIQELKKQAKIKKVEYEKIFDRHIFLLKDSEALKIEFVYYNHNRKPLGRKIRVLGVLADSLEDIAANKVVAYFDRNEPKDLFDIYFLLTKGKFTPNKLLGLVLRKFGVQLTESLFWSEAFKKIRHLPNLIPLLPAKSGQSADKLLDSIADYFEKRSAEFLRKNLD